MYLLYILSIFVCSLSGPPPIWRSRFSVKLDTGFHEILRNTHEINNDSDASAESKKVRDVEEGVWRGGGDRPHG